MVSPGSVMSAQSSGSVSRGAVVPGGDGRGSAVEGVIGLVASGGDGFVAGVVREPHADVHTTRQTTNTSAATFRSSRGTSFVDDSRDCPALVGRHDGAVPEGYRHMLVF